MLFNFLKINKESIRKLIKCYYTPMIFKISRNTALMYSFTEPEGDIKDKTTWESTKNIRISYPLQCGFDLYKG